jgi:hypothetical protein
VPAVRTQAQFPAVPEKSGHYESFYLKANRPGGGQGVWIRYTVHKRPGEPLTGSLWFTFFDHAAPATRAAKLTADADRVSAPEGGFIRIGDAVVEPGRASGEIKVPDLDATWDLRFGDGADAMHHLPYERLYRARLPRTKFLSPYPASNFDGELTLNGEVITLAGWPGMIGHNWGAEHAERWVWIQGSGFDGRSPEDYFDMAVGRIKVAGRTTPWVGNAMLMLDGKPHRLGGFGHVPSTEVEESPTGARFELKGKDVKVSGNVRAAAKDFVAWIYADPVGPEHNTLNCSVSDLELDMELDGGPAQRLAVKGAAAYEFGTRDKDHGIPVQPYPDG